MSVPIRSSEITSEHAYLNRRQFLKSVGLIAAGSALLAACGPNAPEPTAVPLDPNGVPEGGEVSAADVAEHADRVRLSPRGQVRDAEMRPVAAAEQRDRRDTQRDAQ